MLLSNRTTTGCSILTTALTTKQTKMAVTVQFRKGGIEVYSPKHEMVKNCVFEYNPNEDRKDTQYSNDWDAKCDAELLDAIATVGERNGQNANDFMHLFPAILRMLKSNSPWAK